MESILFAELTADEQETLQGGSGYYEESGVVNNVVSGSTASASESQSQGQQAQQQGLLSVLGLK